MLFLVESFCNGEEYLVFYKLLLQKFFYIRLGWKLELDIILFLEIRVEERGVWFLVFDLVLKYLVMVGVNLFLM